MTNILIVEDNPFMQATTKKILENLGYQPDIAATGAEALVMTNSKNYPIILLDCEIPVISGYEVATELRKREASGIKRERSNIIACTANALEGDREKCIDSGMDDYVKKPATQETLKEAIDKWLTIYNQSA